MQSYFSHFLDIFNKRNERNIEMAQKHKNIGVIYIKNYDMSTEYVYVSMYSIINVSNF